VGLKGTIVIGALAAVAVTAVPEVETTRVLENDLVTVERHLYSAGATSAMHAHTDRVNVFLSDLHVHVTTGDGKKFEATRQEGTAVWSEATSHALRAESDFDVVVVELRSENGTPIPISSQDATRVDPKHHALEFENEWVRIVRLRLPPGVSTLPHGHSLPAVTVLLSDAQIRVVGDDGQPRGGDRREGDVRWMDPTGQHTVENVGQTELLAIRVEIKQAPARP
jgi:hypothetical protein